MNNDILNSATFDDIQKSFVVTVQPFQYEGAGIMDLGGQTNVLWVKNIGWEYRYLDVGVPGATRAPVKRIKVSAGDILQDAQRALPPFIEPRPIFGKLPFRVINTNLHNNHKLEVEFFITGVLVAPRPGKEPLPFKVMKGYVMLDSAERGRLAMKEAATDKLDETLTSLGLGGLRDLPGGLDALKELPTALQTVIIQGMAAKGELPEYMTALSMPALGMGIPGASPLALPSADPEKEESSFMGDLIATCPDECDFNKEQLKTIAMAMVEKGWRRV